MLSRQILPNQRRGDTDYFDGVEWRRLPIGTSGQVLWVSSGLPAYRTLVLSDVGSVFATNTIVLGTAAAAGAATTTLRSDSTIAAFDTTVPVTQAFGDTAATGSVAFAARRDHTHGMPTGAWTTVTYDANNFTANLGATWTVASGDQSVFAYLLLGKMMWVSLAIQTSSISVANPTILTVPIPASKTAAKTVYTPCYLLDNSTRTTGYMQATGTTINIQRTDVAAFATATDTTWVLGQIFLETT